MRNKIHPILADISDYRISSNSFDYIFSVSAIEHLATEKDFDTLLDRMIAGTKAQGINCILISTGITETLVENGESLDPMFELLFETEALIHKLQERYRGWTILKQTVKPYEIEITREVRKVLLTSHVLTWAVRKNTAMDG